MPNNRKPTAVLIATGRAKHDPQRMRARVGEPDTRRGIGAAPSWLSDEERAVWDEIVGDCAPGVFQSSDRPMLAGFAALETERRADPRGFGGRKWQAWITLLARCGMTPADRSRVRVAPSEAADQPKRGLAKFI